jgi:enediyne biosynthesis protein E4
MAKWHMTGIVVAAGIVGLLAGLAVLVTWGRQRSATLQPLAQNPQGPNAGSPASAPGTLTDIAAPPVRPGGLPEGLAAPQFTDITESSGVRFTHVNGRTGQYHYPEIMGAGVALFDYDGDGDLDLYLVNGNHLTQARSPDITNKLYRNNGDGTFTDVTATARVGDTGYGQGCCTGDYDNDGREDLYVTNFGPNVLYHNDGNGTFTDVAAKAGVQDALWGQSCGFLDYDADGWLDLYVQNYLTYSLDQQQKTFTLANGKPMQDYNTPRAYKGAPSHLYHNNRNGTFTDVTQHAGVDRPGGKGMGLACVDFDEDGDIDILQTNDGMENYYFQNQGNGTFKELAGLIGLGYSAEGQTKSFMGVDVGDFDGDGLLDVVVPALRREVFALYRNAGNQFIDVSWRAGLGQATARRTGFSPNFIDYDNDGHLDLFFTCGGVLADDMAPPNPTYEQCYGQPDLLLANDGKGRFVDVSDQAGSYFRRRLIGRGSAAGDIDNDGDIDLVINNLEGPAVVLRNDTKGGHWITLRLLGPKGDAPVIGAKVHLTAGGKTQYTVTQSQNGYLSVSDRRVHFGLGTTTRVDSVEIVWPGGSRQTLKDVPIDAITTIRQPTTQPTGA